MRHFLDTLDDYDQVEELFYEMSRRFEVLLTEHFSANRAMNEYAKRQLESHELTKKIFAECIAMMKAFQRYFLTDGYTDQGLQARAAAGHYRFLLRNASHARVATGYR